MNSKSLYTLEFNKILEQLAGLAETEGAAEMALRLTPSSDIEKVRKTGVTARMEVVNADILNVRAWSSLLDECSLILADPPYAVSAELFRSLMADREFISHASGCFLVWEIPDTPGALGEFLDVPGLSGSNVRKFGGTLFLMGTISE